MSRKKKYPRIKCPKCGELVSSHPATYETHYIQEHGGDEDELIKWLEEDREKAKKYLEDIKLAKQLKKIPVAKIRKPYGKRIKWYE